VKKRILVSDRDMDRLSRIVEGGLSTFPGERDNIARLESELDRAKIVRADRIPPDLITMHSEVSLSDLDTGEQKVYRLVYPSEGGRWPNSLSVLAPVGMALLGYSKGDVIQWQVPRGMRRLKVLDVVQPASLQKISAA
jgi:regulator of nucleoside diphosphate kinase